MMSGLQHSPGSQPTQKPQTHTRAPDGQGWVDWSRQVVAFGLLLGLGQSRVWGA